MLNIRQTFLFTCLLFSVQVIAQNNYVQYVNPFIGTGGHGHTYPGATLPHGMVQLSPDTRLDGWDGCGGYHYSDNFIYGFSHTHLSGTGVPDYGDILLMPMNGKPSPDNKVYGSSFSHQSEKASPGYYAVTLDDSKIDVECTATERVGFHHYTFSKTEDAAVILDLKHRDEVLMSSLQWEDSVTISGMRLSKGWAQQQYVYFVMTFSKPFREMGFWQDDKQAIQGLTSVDNAKNLKAYFTFDLATSADIFVKVAISPVSIEGAKKNLQAELPGWDFSGIKHSAEKKWNEELGRIEVKDPDKDKMTVFYTALYHTAIVPNLNMDVDRQYRGMDGQIHTADGFDYYSVFSLWDTYRATHPLYTIIDRKRTLDYIKTFLAMYREGGRLPVWELASNETNCMIGYHSIPVIVDAYMKGIRGFDTVLALEAMKKSANWNHFGLPSYRRNGMIAVEDEHESVSKTLEYAYDDWCIAIFARENGNWEDYKTFIRRAQYYRNVFDTRTGFMRPRKNGGWLSPFDPREVNNHFTEANSWQYSFYMPQDIGGYIRQIGGQKKLERKLDGLFSAPKQTTGRDQSDITGLIGQYAHGNEPSHHIAYLYNYAGVPYKTQEKVHEVLTTMYANDPDGLIGNEDCGQMSAWYVLSALGFYPVTPGSDQYIIGSPLFSLAEIKLENERSFIINAPGAGKGNPYIQKIFLSTTSSLKPKEWVNGYLSHHDIAGGGLITCMMGSKPQSYNWQMPELDIVKADPSAAIVLNPVIDGGNMSFKNSRSIRIYSNQKNVDIFYTLDGTEPGIKSKKYTVPFTLTRSTMVKAVAVDKKGKSSFISSGEWKKMLHDWSVTINNPYEQQYDAGGPGGLIDGIRGTENWRMGNWQGYQKTDMDVTVDLKMPRHISQVEVGFLQETKSWIVMPRRLSVLGSLNGKDFKVLYLGGDYMKIEEMAPTLKKVMATFPKEYVRYVRIVANQYGKLPGWHEGAGGDTHIFVDEIDIQ